MNPDNQALLILAYLLPVAMAAWLLSARLQRRSRLLTGLLLILPVFYIGHYLLIERLQGWPSRSPLPDNFRLLAHRVVEPDLRTGDAGRILIWLQPYNTSRPRVHETDYDATLHRQLSAAAKRQAAGRPQRGLYRDNDPTGENTAGPDRTRSLQFRDIAQNRLPAKTTDR